MPSTTTKPCNTLGIATNGNVQVKIQLIDDAGKGSTVWWTLNQEQARLLYLGLDAYLNAQYKLDCDDA